MHIVEITPADEVGLSPSGLDRAAELLASAVRSGFIPGLATTIYRHGKLVRVGFAGTRNPDEPSLPMERDTIFLIASLTKPVVCAGALLLLQEGAFALDQPLSLFIPEFSGHGKEQVLIRHLFTHTSGLHDQLPESPALRGRQAPLRDFVRATCASELLFPPGTRVSYQSMGILMLGELVERLTGMRLRGYLHDRLFAPLGMGDTTLGMPPSGLARAAYSLPPEMPPGRRDVHTDWNTPYWRDAGAPWGGLHSTAEDLGRFLMHMLGESAGPLSPALRAAMTSDQTALLPGISAAQKLTDRWGLGWKLGSSQFGDLLSRDTFGHGGATGALYWADPQPGLACVLLTNQPGLLRRAPREHDSLAARYGNALASAVSIPAK
jgi:CubicO group peptidase (beta-lactamase class C family)